MTRAPYFFIPLSTRLHRYTVHNDVQLFIIFDITMFAFCLHGALLVKHGAHCHENNNDFSWTSNTLLPPMSFGPLLFAPSQRLPLQGRKNIPATNDRSDTTLCLISICLVTCVVSPPHTFVENRLKPHYCSLPYSALCTANVHPFSYVGVSHKRTFFIGQTLWTRVHNCLSQTTWPSPPCDVISSSHYLSQRLERRSVSSIAVTEAHLLPSCILLLSIFLYTQTLCNQIQTLQTLHAPIKKQSSLRSKIDSN